MRDDPFILDAWHFIPGSKPVNLGHVDSFEEHCWYHCRRDKEGLAAWLGDIGIKESLIELMVADDTRSHYQDLGNNNFLLVLRGINQNEGDEPDDMISLRIVYYKNSIISLRRKPFNGISHIQKQINDTGEPDTLAELLIAFIEEINFRINAVIDEIDNGIDDIEENIDHLSRNHQRKLTMLHRSLLKISRYLKPQTIALQNLYDTLPAMLNGHAQDIFNLKEQTFRFMENIEANLLQVSMLRNDLQQSVAERMNRNSYYLSLTAGIFLPLSFFTGLFGINIGGLPGVNEPHAFIWFCIAMLVIGLVVFLLLRRLRFW